MTKIDRIAVKTAQTHIDQLWVMEIKPDIEVPLGKLVLFPVSCTAVRGQSLLWVTAPALTQYPRGVAC